MLSAIFVQNVKFVPRIRPPTSPEIWLFQIFVVSLHSVIRNNGNMELKFTLRLHDLWKAHWGFRDMKVARDEAEQITSMFGRQPFSALGYDHFLEFARFKKKKSIITLYYFCTNPVQCYISH